MTLASRLHSGEILAMTAALSHARRGALRYAFRSHADFVLLAPERCQTPHLMGRNKFNLIAFHDTDHGGPRGHGTGSAWAWQQLATVGVAPREGLVLALLAQPRYLGFWFNPVSFWLAIEDNDLVAAIAEVNNTFGQRHSYLLSLSDLAPITAATPLYARKLFYVSPFQDIAGEYRFNLAVQPERIAIRISQIHGEGGIDTAMSGPLRPLTNRKILRSALRRPGGALSVIVQIYWHALRLKLKGARYRKRPSPPAVEISS